MIADKSSSLMATNFVGKLRRCDKTCRALRLLAVYGPSHPKAKCNVHQRVFRKKDSSTESTQVGELILECASKDQWLEDQLSLYTFGEFKSFITQFARKISLVKAVVCLYMIEFAEDGQER